MTDSLTILFATMTGTAEDCAARLAKKLEACGHVPRLVNMRDVSGLELNEKGVILLVVSTWGEGEPPDDAIPFWENVKKLHNQALVGIRFSVFALGDSAYEHFCGFGRDCDDVFERLGAQRFLSRVDCDNNHEELLDGWIESVAVNLADRLASTSVISKS